jgi:hypothetical protein
MIKDKLFRLLVPREVWRRTADFAKTVPCRGKTRAERRRELRSDARWQHANQVAAPHREKKRQKNIELLKLAAAAHSARMVLTHKLFGKPKQAA